MRQRQATFQAQRLIARGQADEGLNLIASYAEAHARDYNAQVAAGEVFTTAGKLLGELASLDSDSALRSRLRHYARPSLLAIDEVGYLSYSSRYADLLFELISRRHEQKSTLLTTNKSFAEWNEVFPNAACVVALVDRLVHHAEIVGIKGQSYRQKEAQEQAKERAGKRKTSKGAT